ncbi:MAG: hypothetical protein B7Z54_00210 [Sphingobacteriales bacterium 12-47-4]|nr:MAG: hypothetical protein B7Z54_00210 [Sphingobacteriales bacterium 12-47-4]
MRIPLTILSLFLLLSGNAQNKEEIRILANTRLLHQTVFGTKDSLVLEKLFGSVVSYGHSSGKVENRAEAIRGILRNRTIYQDLQIDGIQVQIEGTTAVTRHVMMATELTADNQQRPLKLMVVLVWAKQKKEWKLMARQAVKV